MLFAIPVNAHTFTGMVGFYDGLSHPVLGMDHFLAMVSVGIISTQIGGKAIWTLPLTFVGVMVIGGILGIAAEINKGLDDQAISLSEIDSVNYFADYVYVLIEIGIILSVILLGLAIAINKKISVYLIFIFVGIFGFCHGTAHGLEMPWASNPILFALGFASGTATLHLLGVGIGYFALKTLLSSILLRIVGVLCAVYGSYLIFTI
jgi:urease accessory protein